MAKTPRSQNAGAGVRSLVRELSTCTQHGVAREKKLKPEPEACWYHLH